VGDAVVMTKGVPLEGAAIIAREYRIPAVVATGNATGLLRDGEVVTESSTDIQYGALNVTWSFGG
jgi:pyruvate,water dikinase